MFKDITRDDVYRIETQRLWLRWPKLTDAPAIAEALADRRIADMTGRIRHPYPDGEAEQFIFRTREANHDGRGLGLVITPKQKPNHVIGAIGLSAAAEPSLTLELGYWIAVSQWGQRFASEAVTAMIASGLSLSTASGLVATVKPENVASRRILLAHGFTDIGRENRYMPARERDEVVDCFSLSRAAWREGGAWSAFGAAA